MTLDFDLRGTGTATPPIWPLAAHDPTLAYLLGLLNGPCALCMDIDGTISATAPTVAAAVLLPGMRELLMEATQTFDRVATISGRAVQDQQRLIEVPGVWHVGHHGYEWEELDTDSDERHAVLLPEAKPYLEAIAKALDAIEAELAPLVPGLWMERKGITGGVHWRLAQDTEGARQTCLSVVRRVACAYGLRYVESNLAVELFPPVRTDKGTGLQRIIQMHSLHGVIYLGDDVSDTDAFVMLRRRRASHEGPGLAIGVLHSGAPAVVRATADMLIGRTEDVPALIRWMLDIRKPLHFSVPAR